ncbi:hypothetical protein M23134_06993 [Microscilla marina ATCC 23134]|uniref:Uncharacterized protein n=2 Tax=Microscilla marina TaxID=1027 RepID=A1ZT10_MICM2|nr:hypothetical protein M23134_06993 [Microscilla marina ATCC 23134]
MDQEPQKSKKSKKPPCMMKRGFFVLRQCENPAVRQCAITQKPICEDHSVHWEGKIVSTEAYAEEMKKQGKKPSTITRDLATWRPGEKRNYALWHYYMREDFYERQNYAPLVDYDEFDEADEAGFETEAGEYWDEEDGGKGGFYDS